MEPPLSPICENLNGALMSTTGWVILVIANIPVYLLMGRGFFKDWWEFFEAIEYWFTPDIVSGMRGEWHDDRAATLKLLVWLALCIGAVVVEGVFINRFFG